MGMVLIYAILAGIFLFALTILIFCTLITLKYKKTAYLVASILILVILSFTFINSIDEFTYFKSDVTADLKYLEIKLIDDFEIIDNNVTGLPERYQKTKIKITEKDKVKIISEIAKSEKFYKSNQERKLYYDMMGKESLKMFSNYQLNEDYIRESYEMKSEYIANSVYIVINKKQNFIELNKIQD